MIFFFLKFGLFGVGVFPAFFLWPASVRRWSLFIHTHTHTLTHNKRTGERSRSGGDAYAHVRSAGHARYVCRASFHPAAVVTRRLPSLRPSAAWRSVRSSAVDDAERRDRLTDDDDEVKFKLAPNRVITPPPRRRRIFAAAHT